MIRLAVLASGRGSNYLAIDEAIASGALQAEITVVISDREHAPVLEKALQRGHQVVYLPYDRSNRVSFEKLAAEVIDAAECDLVILAGYMRILTQWFIDHYENRILNIHPSLLPSFKGMNAQGQALAYGVKVSGCTVHVVTEQMDAGPIIAQQAVPVISGDTETMLSARILEAEHQLFSQAIASYARELGLS